MVAAGVSDADTDGVPGSGAFQLTHRQIMGALAGVQLSILLGAINATSVATALPDIADDLQGFLSLSWVITAYLIAATVTIPLFGKLSDLYGRRRLFVVAISLTIVGSLLAGAAQSMPQLIAFRAIQGLGGGGLIPLGFAAIGDLFPPRQRPKYQGYISVTFATAAVLGPLVGGLLTDTLSWRWVFWMNIPLGLLALGVLLVTMKVPTARRRHSLDIAGGLTLSAGVVALLLVLVWGGRTFSWGSPVTIGLAIAAAVLFSLFIWIERRAKEPVVPLPLLRNRSVAVPIAVAGLLGAAMYAAIVFLPLYGQGVLGASATRAGALLIPLEVIWSITSVTTGQLVYRTGRYRIFPTLGTLFVCLGCLLLALMGSDAPYARVAVTAALIGIGMGLSVQVLNLAVQNAAKRSEIGIATSLYFFVNQIGSIFAVAVLGTVLARRFAIEVPALLGDDTSRIDVDETLKAPKAAHVPADLMPLVEKAMSAALHWVFLGMLAIGVAAFIVVLFMREEPLRTTHEPVVVDLEDPSSERSTIAS